MSTLNIDIRPLAGAPELPGTQAARPIPSGGSREHAARGAGADRAAVSHGTQPGSEPVPGRIYALKDGSGYVALASDGHYYKLEPGGGGFTYAAASGPVDTSMVDVTHGPVRRMRPVATPRPVGAHAGEPHLPGSGGRDSTVTDGRHAATPRSGWATHTPVDPHVAGDLTSGAHTRIDADNPAAVDAEPHVPGPAGADAAAAAARATHGLIVRHPVAALRSHAGVSPEAVASLLR